MYTHTRRPTHRKKMYIYNNSHINCGNNKKNQRFDNNQLDSYKKIYVSADSNVKKINFVLRNKVSQRITTNCSDVHIDYRRTTVEQKAISVSGAKLWNSIPMNIRNSNTIVTFKSHMYQHLLEHQ